MWSPFLRMITSSSRVLLVLIHNHLGMVSEVLPPTAVDLRVRAVWEVRASLQTLTGR